MRNGAWLLAVLGLGCASSSRPRIDRADQLPVHTYRVPPDVGRLLEDDAAFAELARAVRADLDSDLERYDIRDRAALKDRLFELALLDALDGHFEAALARLDRLAAIEQKPAARVMTGLTIRIWADALRAGAEVRPAFRAALERKLATMPYDLVAEQLAALRAMAQAFSPAVCKNLVEEHVGAAARAGPLSFEQVQAIVFQRWAVQRLVPVGDILVEVLGRVIDAHAARP